MRALIKIEKATLNKVIVYHCAYSFGVMILWMIGNYVDMHQSFFTSDLLGHFLTFLPISYGAISFLVPYFIFSDKPKMKRLFASAIVGLPMFIITYFLFVFVGIWFHLSIGGTP